MRLQKLIIGLVALTLGIITLSSLGLAQPAGPISEFEVVGENFTPGENVIVEAKLVEGIVTDNATAKLYFNDEENAIKTEEVVFGSSGEVNLSLKYEIPSNRTGENQNISLAIIEDKELVNTRTEQINIYTITRNLESGWNYISFPIADRSSPQIGSLLDENKIESVWAYDEEWQNYNPDAPENSFSAVKGGKGYIVKAEENFVLKAIVDTNVSGDSPNEATPASEELQQGWNLVGHYWSIRHEADTNNALDSIPSDHLGKQYEQQKDGSLNLVELKEDDYLKPGYAYWIMSKENSTYTKSKSSPWKTSDNIEDGDSLPDTEMFFEQAVATSSDEENVIIPNNTEIVKVIHRNTSKYDGVLGYLSKEEYNDSEIEIYLTNKTEFSQNTGLNYSSENASKATNLEDNFTKVCSDSPEENSAVACDVDTQEMNDTGNVVLWKLSNPHSDEEQQGGRAVNFAEVLESSLVKENDYWLELSYMGETSNQDLSGETILIDRNTSRSRLFEAKSFYISESDRIASSFGRTIESGESYRIPSIYYEGENRNPDYQTVRIENTDTGKEELELFNISSNGPELPRPSGHSIFENRIDDELLTAEDPGLVNLSYDEYDRREIKEQNLSETLQETKVNFYVAEYEDLVDEVGEEGLRDYENIHVEHINSKGETIESLNSTEKICSSNYTDYEYTCDLSKANLSKNTEYMIYLRQIHKESNTLVWKGSERFEALELYDIGDKAETDNLWFRLNYMEGIIDSDNTDIRELTASSTLKNKNITEEQAFDGIETDFSLIPHPDNNPHIDGPHDVRDGETASRVEHGEVLSSTELKYLLVRVDRGNDLGHKRLIYNISNYTTSKFDLVNSSRKINLSETVRFDNLTLNISNYRVDVDSNNNKDSRFDVYLQNHNYAELGQESISANHQILDENGTAYADHDDAPRDVAKNTSKTEQAYISFEGENPSYILTSITTGYGPQRPYALFEIPEEEQ